MDLLTRLFDSDRRAKYHDRYTFRSGSELVKQQAPFAILKVYDLDQECPVTLKVYDLREAPDVSRELARLMWESEVRVLAQLVPYQWRCPGLVRFVEGGWDEPTASLFVAWEDAYRFTLSEVLQQPKLAPTEFERLDTRVNLMVMLADALHELHAHGIIHREITSEALCLWDSPQPRAAFTNFGMSIFANNFLWAPTADTFSSAGTSGRALGYSAPERLAFLAGGGQMLAAGEDYRQDFFSLGLVLTEWLARPFEDASFETFLPKGKYDEYAHFQWIIDAVHGRIDREHFTNDGDVQAATRQLLRTLTEFQPDDRFATSGQFVRAAREVQSLLRSRNYRRLCEQPFKIVFSPKDCVTPLDSLRPLGTSRRDLPLQEQASAIQAELQAEVDSGRLWVGFEPEGSRWARDNWGRERWVLVGPNHKFRLEIFRRELRQECPWLAYIQHIVVGSVEYDAPLQLVPFTKVVAIALKEAGEHARGHVEHNGVGRWDNLLIHLREARLQSNPPVSYGNAVLLEALDESIDIQEAQPDAETYAVGCAEEAPSDTADQDPFAPLDSRRIALTYSPERDDQFVQAHEYIGLFEGTLGERKEFRLWAAGLKAGSRVEFAPDLRALHTGRGCHVAVVESADPENLVVRVPSGVGPVPRDAYVCSARTDRYVLTRLREGVARLREDRFRQDLLRAPEQLNVPLPWAEDAWLTAVKPDPNKKQAVNALLRAHPVFFLQGPPGTGKTATATEVVARILKANPAARVLVTAQANDALDNLARDIIESTPERQQFVLLRVPSTTYKPKDEVLAAHQPLNALNDFFRHAIMLGNRHSAWLAKNHPALACQAQPVSDSWTALLKRRHSEFERVFYRSANVVFATCLGASRLDRFDVDRFDWVIVEEAARAHPTELLLPLLRANRCLLIGDHLQLEPFKADVFGAAFRKSVQRRLAEEEAGPDGETATSAMLALETERSHRYLALFSHLFEASADTQHATLTACYRMHPALCRLTDRLFYAPGASDQPLLEAQPTVEERSHPLRSRGEAASEWLQGRAIVWLDTSGYRARAEETLATGETSRSNLLEAELVARLLDRTGRDASPLTLMLLSVYARQVELLAGVLTGRREQWKRARALTIMASQGGEADVVVVSLVRSNTAEKPGLAIGDIRRDSTLNVALSRAKRLLVLVGDQDHFRRFGKGAGRIEELVKVFDEGADPLLVPWVLRHSPSDLLAVDWLPERGRA